MESLEISVYSIISFADSDSLSLSLISFRCLIVVVRTCSSMLKKSGEFRHPFHVLFSPFVCFLILFSCGLT